MNLGENGLKNNFNGNKVPKNTDAPARWPRLPHLDLNRPTHPKIGVRAAAEPEVLHRDCCYRLPGLRIPLSHSH